MSSAYREPIQTKKEPRGETCFLCPSPSSPLAVLVLVKFWIDEVRLWFEVDCCRSCFDRHCSWFALTADPERMRQSSPVEREVIDGDLEKIRIFYTRDWIG